MCIRDSSSTVQSAAKTAGMNAATPLTVSSDWNGIHPVSYTHLDAADRANLAFGVHRAGTRDGLPAGKLLSGHLVDQRCV